jgi:hypothetical protein
MSRPITVSIPHKLGQAEARRRLATGFSRIRDQIGGKAVEFEERWEGDRLHFRAGAFGQRVSGYADVQEQEVLIEIELPWILASIADKLPQRIKKAGTLLLEKK